MITLSIPALLAVPVSVMVPVAATPESLSFKPITVKRIMALFWIAMRAIK